MITCDIILDDLEDSPPKTCGAKATSFTFYPLAEEYLARCAEHDAFTENDKWELMAIDLTEEEYVIRKVMND